MSSFSKIHIVFLFLVQSFSIALFRPAYGFCEQKEDFIELRRNQVLLELKNDPFATDITDTRKEKDKRRKDTRQKVAPEKVREGEDYPIKVVGSVIFGDNRIAIFEIGGKTYILSEGDSLTNLSRTIKVKKIGEDFVELLVEDKEIRMSF